MNYDLIAKRKLLGMLAIVIFILSALLIAPPVNGDPGTTHYVDAADPTCGGNSPCYSAIQAAINAASAGDTVIVAPGTYDENLGINKPVSLIGAGHTVTTVTTTKTTVEYLIFLGTTSGTTFSLGMTIEGFTLTSSTLTGDKDLIGLRASGPSQADPIIIRDNVFDGSFGTIKGIETRSGSALSNVVIQDNTFINCRYAMFFNSAINVVIEDNTIANSYVGGIEFSTSDLNQIHGVNVLGNVITYTGVDRDLWPPIYWEWFAGILIGSTCYDMTVSENTISNGYAYGFVIQDRGHPEQLVNVHINSNEIYANALGSLNELTIPVDATNNWWGDSTGPYHPTSWLYDSQVITNPDGNGDEVSDYLLYDPWKVGEVLVEIDIKPGSYPNSINLKSRGVVPVAVLTTEGFDAGTVDPGTVLFAGASPARWSLEDVNGDDKLDFVLHFKTQELDLTSASTEATLTGSTYDDVQIKGTDTVNIVPKK